MFQKNGAEKIEIHILCSGTFFRKSCRLWDNVEKSCTTRQATDDNIIQRMLFACWITKATDTHSEYVILIAFAWQQWLRERASMLRQTYSACLVFNVYRPWSRSIVNATNERTRTEVTERSLMDDADDCVPSRLLLSAYCLSTRHVASEGYPY
jgi:hypothetical protein